MKGEPFEILSKVLSELRCSEASEKDVDFVFDLLRAEMEKAVQDEYWADDMATRVLLSDVEIKKARLKEEGEESILLSLEGIAIYAQEFGSASDQRKGNGLTSSELPPIEIPFIADIELSCPLSIRIVALKKTKDPYAEF